MRRLGLVLAFAAGCGAPIDDDFGIDEVLGPNEPSGGKEDNAGIAGPLIATNTSATQVWTASNKWEDRTTTEAKKAGLVWGVDSGLNWDEKYSKWIDSLEVVDSAEALREAITTARLRGERVPHELASACTRVIEWLERLAR